MSTEYLPSVLGSAATTSVTTATAKCKFTGGEKRIRLEETMDASALMWFAASNGERKDGCERHAMREPLSTTSATLGRGG